MQGDAYSGYRQGESILEDSGWTKASDFESISKGYYYGDADDIGTPTYRKGKPLQVTLSYFAAKTPMLVSFSNGQLSQRWTTQGSTSIAVKQRTVNSRLSIQL